jgi:hypothetical protein
VLASAPEPHATVEAAEAPTEAEGSPPDLVEDTVSTTGSTPADVPASADLIEPGPSPELVVPREEPVTVADPEPESPVNGHTLEAVVAREESHAAAAPEAIEIDQVSPADPFLPESVTEEYGIAPSAFGPDLLEAPLQEEAREQGWTGLPVLPGAGAKALADAGIELSLSTTRESDSINDPGPMPEVADGDSPPVWIGSDRASLRRGSAGNRYGWVRLKPRSKAHPAPGYFPGSGASRQVQNLRSGSRGRSLTELGMAANPRAQAQARWNLGRSPQAHRGFQPRSPPARW